jgi:hypothetical protein
MYEAVIGTSDQDVWDRMSVTDPPVEVDSLWCLGAFLTLRVVPRATAVLGTGGPAPAPDR